MLMSVRRYALLPRSMPLVGAAVANTLDPDDQRLYDYRSGGGWGPVVSAVFKTVDG
jgi:hypothetical protein